MSDQQRRRVALLVAACFFMEILDGTIVVTAIPRIATSLSVSPSSGGLIVTAYFVTAAVLIPLSAWMTARFGVRRLFLAAILVFACASLGCAASTSLPELVAFRVMQGAGGAMMVPVGRILVFSRAPKSQIVTLTSYIVWPALVAPVVAPLAGGLITVAASWRWIFLINLPLGIVAFAVARRVIVPTEIRRPAPLDRGGVLLTCTGLAALVAGAQLVGAAHPRWAALVVLAAASAVLLGLAARHLLIHPAPLLDLRTLAIPTFGIATTGLAIGWLTLGAIPFLLPLLFQTQFGWGPVKSGAIVLFLFLGNVAIKPATTPLYRRLGFRRMLLIAAGALVATTLAMAGIGASTPVALIALVLFLSGVARSTGLTGVNTLALGDVPEAQMPDAQTLGAVVQQLFSGLGVAAGTLALRAGRPLGSLLSSGAGGAAAFRIAFVLLALVAAVSCLNVLRLAPDAGAALLTPRG